jgi:hypothetical protein
MALALLCFYIFSNTQRQAPFRSRLRLRELAG